MLSSGWSQGGGSAAALAELDGADFGELNLLGSALISPGVTGVALANPIGMGSALTDPNSPPDSHLAMMLAGHAAAIPELELSDVFTPLGVELITAIADTQPVHHINDTLGRTFTLKGAILAITPESLEKLKQVVAKTTACTRKPRGKVLVCVDSFKGGTVIPVGWQTDYVEAATKLGGDVEVADFPNDDHFSLPASSIDRICSWFARLISESSGTS